MKPCDCDDMYTLLKLNEQGIAFSDVSFDVRPLSVILKVGACTLRIPQKHFKRLVEWYLEDQDDTLGQTLKEMGKM